MLFSSYPFLLLFVPLTITVYYQLQRFRSGKFALLFLLLASLFYYGYWKVENLWIIFVSIFANFFLSKFIAQPSGLRKHVYILAVILNLGLLGYFKYTDFLISNINALSGTSIPLQHIVLPIGISFFTFQQIAYLTDIYSGKYIPPEKGIVNYALFISFFPQLVAGPIVHHSEMMPQFEDPEAKRLHWENIYAALVLLSIGLAKKVLLADSLGPFVGYCFDTVDSLTFSEALAGSLAYSLQLYFDFSGYSDMAVGCGLFFNIRLPFNFLSPYKAANPQEFWRRWHITLSRWLSSYVYIPMGGNRKGTGRTVANLFATFLLGGLWHGAAWTFVLWGALHGLAVSIHRLWTVFSPVRIPRALGIVLTFSFVNMAWITFRATSFDRVAIFMEGFLGQNGFTLRRAFRAQVANVIYGKTFSLLTLCVILILLFIMVLVAKNSAEIADSKPSMLKTVFCTGLILASLYALGIPEKYTEFIYFQF